MLCDNLEECDGVRVTGKFNREGDISILMADSLCHMAETSTTLESNFPSIKKFKN